MKRKFAALFSALLLTLALLPAQALAAEEPDPEPPVSVTEPGDQEDQPDSRKIPGKPAPDPEVPKPDRRDH